MLGKVYSDRGGFCVVYTLTQTGFFGDISIRTCRYRFPTEIEAMLYLQNNNHCNHKYIIESRTY